MKLKSSIRKYQKIIDLEEQRDHIRFKQRNIANTIKNKGDWQIAVNWINEH